LPSRRPRPTGALFLTLATAGLVAVVVMLAGTADSATRQKAAAKPSPTRSVLYVGNNWDGTADIVDAKTFKSLRRINIVPDKAARMTEIELNPVSLAYFLAIRQQVGEGHDQLVDDMFSSKDGRYLYVSRPSFADVVAIDLITKKIVWRTKVEGNRSDHMAISPNGKELAVSASTAGKVHIIETATGHIRGSFPSGDQPHENNYSRDGRRIYHASIGTVYTPTDDPSQDAAKGKRVFEIVDAQTLKVLRTINMAQRLAEFGIPSMSAAVRPMALSPDERYVYFQLSFFHGFVEYDLKLDRPTRMVLLPLSAEAKAKKRPDYLLDSAHHGLAMQPNGLRLCAAGTISDYAAIVTRSTLRARIVPVGHKPYWSTNSGDGRYCFVSVSGDDKVAVINYATARKVAEIPVGDHPQRMRMGTIRAEALS
jgi:YVTN family beta-propeller protein